MAGRGIWLNSSERPSFARLVLLSDEANEVKRTRGFFDFKKCTKFEGIKIFLRKEKKWIRYSTLKETDSA